MIAAHPAQHASRVNTTLIAAARALPFVTVHRLYASYPDFFIDTRREQQLLIEHDVLVLQHPFYWYSVPALLKEWIDLVLEHGWAYGPSGDRLHGKTWAHAISTGGSQPSYTREGLNQYSMDELLRPLEQTARLCAMRWAEPFVVHAARRLDDTALDTHTQRYADWLTALARSATPRGV